MMVPHQAVPGCEVAVDEVLALQIRHPAGDLGGHVHEDHLVDLGAVGGGVGGPQVVQQVAARHELRHDVERGLPGTNAQQLKQKLVPTVFEIIELNI